MRKIVLLVCLCLLCGCGVTGRYQLNSNSATDVESITINKDKTYTLNWSNDIAGNHQINGIWKKSGSLLYLKESNDKFKNNKIIKLGSKKENYLKILDLEGYPIMFAQIQLGTGKNDLIEADIDGFAFLKKDIGKVNVLKVYDSKETDNLLGEFKIDLIPGFSYEILIDYKTVSRSFCASCPTVLLKKGKRLFPLDDINSGKKEVFYEK